MKLKKTSYVLLLLVLLHCLSCGVGERQSTTLVVGIISDTDSLNPLLTRTRFGGELSKMLFLSLMEEQPDFITFKPQLARSWDFSKDGTTVTFHLRTDVFWIDSVKVNAKDVHFTYNIQKDKAVGWSGKSVKDRITEVKVLDDSTVQFIFDEPYMYRLMDINEGAILPEHILGDLSPEKIKNCDFNHNPITNGPFKLKSWISNQHIELVRNELYFDQDLPRIPHLVFKIVPDKTQLLGQLKTGEIQVMESLPPREAEKMTAGNHKLKIESFPFGQYVQIAWNLNNSLFKDIEIRHALTMAIDRRALVDHLLGGYGQVCTSPIHPILWAHDLNLKPLPFDPDMAMKFLNDNGWTDSNNDDIVDKNGRNFEFQLLANIGSGTREDAQVMIQEMLRKIGIKVITQRLEWSVYVEKMMAREFDAVIIGMMSPSKVDPMPGWHSSMIGPEGFNLSCYSNPKVDALIEQARVMIDRQQAQPLWNDFQRIIIKEQPATFLWIPDRVVGLDKRINGYRFSPTSTFFNIAEWTM